MHYQTPEEASEKWNRRKLRINYDNLVIKFSEISFLCSPELVARFASLDYPRKICFTLNMYDFDCCIHIPEFQHIVSGGDETPYTLPYINIYRIVNPSLITDIIAHKMKEMLCAYR